MSSIIAFAAGVGVWFVLTEITALESFVAFRGRPPQLDALLRHNGMVET